MKTTLDIPDELAAEVQRRAERSGQALVEQVVQLLRVAMLVEDIPALLPILGVYGRSSNASRNGGAKLSNDPVTGLPVIDSPPDAPMRFMNAEQIAALIEQGQREEDLERAGFAIRH